MNQSEAKPSVHLAALGDLSADWVFHEATTSPTRPAVGTLENWPWKHYQNCSFHAIPGGAWYVSSLLRGALKRSHLDMESTVTLEPGESKTYTIRGTLRDSLHLDATGQVEIQYGRKPKRRASGNLILKPRSGKVSIELEVTRGTIVSLSPAPDQPCANLFSRTWELDRSRFKEGSLEITGIRIREATLARVDDKEKVRRELSITVPDPCKGRVVPLSALQLDDTFIGKLGGPLKIESTFRDTTHDDLDPCASTVDDSRIALIPWRANVSMGAGGGAAQPPIAAVYSLSCFGKRGIKRLSPDDIIHTMARLELRPQADSETHAPPVYRRVRKHGIASPAMGSPRILDAYPREEEELVREWRAIPQKQRIVLIDDEGFGFTTRDSAWKPWVQTEEPPPLVIIKCGRTIPITREMSSNSSLYHWISKDSERRDRCVLVLTSNGIRNGRHTGSEIALCKPRSWDEAIRGLRDAFNNLKSLPARHCVITFGLTGAAYLDLNKDEITLIYDPSSIEDEYADRHTLGEVMGTTSVITACIASEAARRMAQGKGKPLTRDTMTESLELGIRSCRRQYMYGFGSTPETIQKFEELKLPSLQVFQDHRPEPTPLGSITVSRENRGEEGDTSILANVLTHQIDPPLGSGMDEVGRLARRIIINGLAVAHESQIPALECGNLLTVDHTEIEGLRAIRSLITGYRTAIESRPISIAVFGPPGSGKSFGVKQVVESLRGHHRFITVNMTQVDAFSEVALELLSVRDANLEGQIPVVFFDEFDLQDRSEHYVWLSRFLQPMQDGEIVIDHKTTKLGKVVFVFAGGIHSSFSEFNKQKGDEGYGRFRADKGPDFVSRLMGHLDVAGPNLRDIDVLTEHKLRRAVLIRSIIKRHYKGLIHDGGHASIDTRVLNALLEVDRYSHGARSVEAIFRMSSLGHADHFGIAELPEAAQLEIHAPGFRSKLR